MFHVCGQFLSNVFLCLAVPGTSSRQWHQSGSGPGGPDACAPFPEAGSTVGGGWGSPPPQSEAGLSYRKYASLHNNLYYPVDIHH